MPLPRGDLRDRIEGLKEYAEWSRCVLEEARKATGAFDPATKCGKAPAPPNIGIPKEIPEKPNSQNG
jgi:hypothetical protein